ncbi:MAG: hypothetical protein JJT88_07055 [Gammaproteobacteria bacterium]|nr:hypothetical protein [Gammaproteobacteria bacterium]
MSTSMSNGFLVLLLALLLGGCAAQPAPGDEPGESGEASMEQDVSDEDVASAPDADAVYEAFPPGAPQRCIDVRRIRRIEPIGNHTLLFHVGGGEVWRNRLPRSCPGLRRHSRFLYEPRSGRLCSLDVVYLLEDHGFGFRRGAGCPLGEFDYLTEEQAEALKNLR